MAEAWDFEELIVDGVTVDYGRRRILSRVSFRCPTGSITGLVGPNGAGKTTLLNVISTRARPSAGQTWFGRRAGTGGDRRLRARIGWLGHDPGLYPELTARENLRFFGEIHALEDVETRVEAALGAAGLEARGDDAVGSFSRGMRQRIGLERVLLHAPRLVLLDEPFTGLDAASSRLLLARLAALKARGCIVLLSTHDLELVTPVLDSAIVLRDGRVLARLTSTPTLPDAVRRALETASSAGPVEVDAADGAGPQASSAITPPASVGARAHSSSQPGDDDDEPFLPLARSVLKTAAIVARKDLTVEFRSRELLLTTLFFALSTVLVFAFAFVREGRAMSDAAAGILWVATAFSGTLALGRTFDREQANQTLPALLQAPVERAAVYIGKLAGLFGLAVLVLTAIVPLVGLLFQARVLQAAPFLAGLLATGCIGFLAVGSLFAAMLVRTRSRDVLLPVLLYPMTVPVLLAGVRGTGALLQETPDIVTARMWLTMLVFFDAVFVTLALWTFDAVTSE